MLLESFDLTYAKSLDDAIDLKNEWGDEAAFYAGGTELLQVLKEGLIVCNHLISLRRVPSMDQIMMDEDSRLITIGAMATHDNIAHSSVIHQYHPAFAELENNIGNIRVRTAGTIGGNLAFAEPRSDPGAFLVAANAIILAKSSSKTRRIPMSEFWQGPFETSLEPGEVITHVLLPVLEKRTGAAYRKFSVAEFPMAGVAAIIQLDDQNENILKARLVVSAANPIPTRLTNAEKLLAGEAINDIPKTVAWWVAAAEPQMDALDDNDGSAEYKTQVVGALLREAVTEAIQRAKEEGHSWQHTR
ncbi:FAD binding domain-containing protein [Peribacillus sp. SCS-155]|uniref:FAD binding domain-containing protein n=1 Tax=Peribacillus sedimenti TaxID=3115297 RepID=UPI00390645D8